MTFPAIENIPNPKPKQTSCRLTDEQAAALRRHCVRTGQSASDVIVAALATVVDGFKNKGNT